eukprot:CAMPEP_0194093918 /NCGR_PEP_ID=MMETSP0149-20130528/52107_1 /TAXON_ID=122233 /ORGANISM="Chaetoceros debilis, Strain MM31A-1" /LENGTH=52 /DNA_ID=CAMNT_0038779385 /DNA_START=33 /DNA_END=188 /DNA_ORIENTATION=+
MSRRKSPLELSSEAFQGQIDEQQASATTSSGILPPIGASQGGNRSGPGLGLG